jgi:hypothetical protein
MSRLDDLKYALASVGYSAERIEAVEQDVFNGANASELSVERVARDTLAVLDAYGVFRVMRDFQESMQQLVIMAGESQNAIGTVSQGILGLANIPDQSIAPKPTERTPYYQRNKQRWWK